MAADKTPARRGLLAIWRVKRRPGTKAVPVAVLTVLLAVFYLLLQALVEQIEFTFAYLFSAAINVLAQSVYGMRLAGRARVFLYVLPALAAIYGALYAFLEVEDQALLIAATVILAGLTISMILTPRIAWYGDDQA